MVERRTAGLVTASVRETAGIVSGVLAPLVARGVIVRRPRALAMVERVDADRRAVARLQRLRARHGSGPLRLRVPGRSMAVVLAPDHVRRVLDETPEPFTPATREKRAALGHFQPHGVLISPMPERAERRRFNEAVLQTSEPVHGDAGAVITKVGEEMALLLAESERAGELTWDAFATAWWRMVRRVVLGDAARDDQQVSDLLLRLRFDANWAFLRRKRTGTRDEFLRRLEGYVERAEPGSLAHLVATTPAGRGTVPIEQIPQWLFASDAAAWASFRALGLLASHPAQAAAAREELAGRDLTAPQDLPYLRACVLESLRLWPTTPAVLRDTTASTTWDGGELPAGTSLLIYAPLFHRDDEHLDFAHRFAPEVWLDETTTRDWPLIPFSAGPGECGGKNLVLLMTSSALAPIVGRGRLRQAAGARFDPAEPLPGTLSPFRLRFQI